MELVTPMKEFVRSWSDALREFELEHTTGFWNIPQKPKNGEEYIKRVERYARGEHLPDWFVSNTTFWLVDQGKFVGHVNIRHALNKKLKKEGGNIGYAIRPPERKKGYGSKILHLALLKAQEIGLQKVLVTCDEDNIASRKIIENNGGIFYDANMVKEKRVRRYWISLF